jgi:glucosamine-6-phosphate deaminase
MPRTALRVLDSPEAIGEDVASGILDRAGRARAAGRPFLLGCPTGRTPRPIYAAMAKRAAALGQDMSHVVLVMMDEYLVPGVDGLSYASPNAPWSCHHFARAVITDVLNAELPPVKRLRDDHVWFPDPRDPEEYETRIVDAGGIDYFLLASGASDGHVAFNPPGSRR